MLPVRVLVVDPAPDQFAIAELEAFEELGVSLIVNARRIGSLDVRAQVEARYQTVDFNGFDEGELSLTLRSQAPIDIVKFRAGIPLTRRVLQSSTPAPRLLIRAAAGLDNVDVDAAREQGTIVASVPGANASAVAEYVVGATIHALRGVPVRDLALHRRDWMAAIDGLPARQLSDCLIGVVGGGSIGTRVVSLARAFGAEVLWLPSVRHATSTPSMPGVRIAASLEEVLQNADVVSLHLALTSETRGILGEGELRQMKFDALLVNTSRGELLDERALSAALRSAETGPAHAIVDVFAQEQSGFDSPLVNIPHVTLTPHMSGMTQGAMKEASERVVSAIASFLAGGDV